MKGGFQQMDSEDDLRRPRAPRPYSESGLRLEVPEQALSSTLRLLQDAGRRESGLFWYGTRDDAGNGRVQYVVAPRQRMAPRNYAVATEALSEIVHQLPDGLKPLAQVHSHPGRFVEHSRYDDEMASSKKALSLVFPFYGHAAGAFLEGIGVHEFQIDYWHYLAPDVAARRVVSCVGNVKVDDFR
jgi:hypothetical protein